MSDPSSSQPDGDWVISDDSRLRESSSSALPGSGEFIAVRDDSGALLDEPPAVPSSHLPEPTSLDALSQRTASPLTAEIFASGTLPAGTTLGHYVIKSYIGGGGMGRVYLATDTALDRSVAVKVLPRQRANDQGTVARFMNEARSAARLNHEHIAQVYFAGEQAGIPYIVFEYVEGTNVRALVEEDDTFPLPQALNYLIQIAHALAHAAGHGVVHRDVKPSNILITREGRAKLIDMGLARLLDPSSSKDDLTASGVTLGTFDYISPEQARDPRNADTRSDIYSLGCTFFFMLSGRPPFPEGTVLQKLLQHQGDEPPDIRSFQPNIPSEIAVLLQKMMAKDPRQRFQTPTALVEALMSVAKMLGLQPTGPGKLIWVMGSPSRASMFLKHIPWIIAVSLLLLAVIPMKLFWKNRDYLPLPDMPDVALVEPLPEPRTVPKPRIEENNTPERQPMRSGTPSLTAVAYVPKLSEPFDNVPKVEPNESDRAIALSGRISPARNAETPSGLAVGLPPFSSRLFGDGFFDRSARLDVSRATISGGSRGESRSGSLPETLPARCTVDPSGTSDAPNTFPTLAIALANTGPEAVIELKWRGIMKIDPLTLSHRKVRLVAARDYAPSLVFEPSDAMGGSSNFRTMMTLQSSELEFQDLAVEMNVRREYLGLRWSMFEMLGTGNKLGFNGCTLTLSNAGADNAAYHDDVAFFRTSQPGGIDPVVIENAVTVTPVFPSPLSETIPLPGGVYYPLGDAFLPAASIPEPERQPDSEIRLQNAVLRGEATAVQCDVPLSMEIRVDNCLIALAKPFVQVEDTRRTQDSRDRIRIVLNRLTFFGRQMFVRQNTNSVATKPLKLEVQARQSIFHLSRMPLATIQGVLSVQEGRDYFSWTGERVFLQNVEPGWQFRQIPMSSHGGLEYDMPLPDFLEATNGPAESDSGKATQVNVLAVDDIRKPIHQIQATDLTPQYPLDSPRRGEAIGAGCSSENGSTAGGLRPL